MEFGKKDLRILAAILILMGIFQFYYAGYGDFAKIFNFRSGKPAKIIKCLNEADYVCVRNVAQKLIDEHPDNAAGYYYLGIADSEEGRFPAAVEQFSKAIELNEKYTDAYSERAEAHFALSENKKALLDINKAIVLDKYRPDFFERRALYNLALKNHKDALSDYKMSAKLYRNVSNYIDADRVSKEIKLLQTRQSN